jgi:hypothetical protein
MFEDDTADEALAWLGRALRWEETLNALHAPEPTDAPALRVVATAA